MKYGERNGPPGLGQEILRSVIVAPLVLPSMVVYLLMVLLVWVLVVPFRSRGFRPTRCQEPSAGQYLQGAGEARRGSSHSGVELERP
jgi:hypothetical protein